MGFTDQKPHVVTQDDLDGTWGCYPAHKYFRCTMCGHTFKLGDTFRWVYTNNLDVKYSGNPLVCENCDGDNVIQRWKELCDEAYSDKFWWFTFYG